MMAFMHHEILVNGEPLGGGWVIEAVTDWGLRPGSLPRYYLQSPEGVKRELDPSRDWIIVDGTLTWGTPSYGSAGPMPAPLAPEPDRLTGKIIGYRGWTLDGYRLRSANHHQHGGFWNIGPNRAECRIEARRAFLGSTGRPVDAAPAGHAAPHRDCECGLYAYFDVRRENNPHGFGPELVWGAVAAWGRVEVHASGFRAEYAEPVVLGYHPRDPYEDVIKHQAIAGELGLPFVRFDELAAEAAKHGRPVPEGMRPAAPPSSLYPTFAPCAWRVGAVAEPSFASGGPLSGLLEQYRQQANAFGVQWPAYSPAPASPPPKTKKGICATIGYPGPPNHRKYRKGDRVKDRNDVIWQCVSGGKPGVWGREETSE
jgi:hypothetical protein